MTKEILYDGARELNLVRIHDGQGNLYCFNIPPETPLDVKSILETGELVTIKKKGESSKTLDGTSDGYFRLYNLLTPIEPASNITHEEIQTLIDENLKTAPAPGEWTRYPQPTPKKKSQQDPPKKEYKGTPILTNKHGKAYMEETRTCKTCGDIIHGERRVTLDDKGEFKRYQYFSPYDPKAGIIPKTDGDWHCSKPQCLAKIPEPQPTPPKIEVKAPLPPTGEVKEFTTINYFKFHEIGGKFFFKGNEITRDPGKKTGDVHSVCKCQECSREIKMVAAVTFKDDKPFRVAANRPIGQPAARPVIPKSSHWLCQSCATGEGKIDDKQPETELSHATESEVSTEHKVIPAAEPQPTVRIPFKNAIKRLEEMAMDTAIDDKVFRGAAYMLTLAIKEE